MACRLWYVDRQFGERAVQIMLLGDLIYARILDQEAVIINSQHDAEALLDKRSRIYSDRPYLATLVPCVLPEFFYSTTLKRVQIWVVVPLCVYGL